MKYTLVKKGQHWIAEALGKRHIGLTPTNALAGLLVAFKSEHDSSEIEPESLITVEKQGERWIASDNESHIEDESAYGALELLLTAQRESESGVDREREDNEWEWHRSHLEAHAVELLQMLANDDQSGQIEKKIEIVLAVGEEMCQTIENFEWYGEEMGELEELYAGLKSFQLRYPGQLPEGLQSRSPGWEAIREKTVGLIAGMGGRIPVTNLRDMLSGLQDALGMTTEG